MGPISIQDDFHFKYTKEIINHTYQYIFKFTLDLL